MDEPYREDVVVTLSPHKRYCHACANINDVRAELCPRCGVRQPPLPVEPGDALSKLQRPLALTVRNVLLARGFALSLGSLAIYLLCVEHLAAAITCFIFFFGFVRTFARSAAWQVSSS